MQRLWSVTVYVFDYSGNNSLFIDHRKLQKMLPPGGKVDPNELPDEAAIRECLEETGVKINLLSEAHPFDGILKRPYGMQLNTIIPGEREHIDFIYMASADMQQRLVFQERESLGVMWIPIKQILAPNFNTFPIVKYWIDRLSKEFKRDHSPDNL